MRFYLCPFPVLEFILECIVDGWMLVKVAHLALYQTFSTTRLRQGWLCIHFLINLYISFIISLNKTTIQPVLRLRWPPFCPHTPMASSKNPKKIIRLSSQLMETCPQSSVRHPLQLLDLCLKSDIS